MRIAERGQKRRRLREGDSRGWTYPEDRSRPNSTLRIKKIVKMKTGRAPAVWWTVQ
jgi:hypothetical protein